MGPWVKNQTEWLEALRLVCNQTTFPSGAAQVCCVARHQGTRPWVDTAMHRLTALLHRGEGVLKLGWWRICAGRTGRNLWLMVGGYLSYHIAQKKKMQKRQTYNFLAWNLPVFRQNNLITNAQINIKLLTYISCWELKAAWPYYESTYKKKCCAVTNLHCTRAWFHLGAECSKECALAITSTMPQPSCCVFHQNIHSSKLALSP